MNKLTKILNYLWLHGWKYKAMERRHAKLEQHLRGKRPLNVVFMALDLSLWRYQHLYELMASDERFQPTIVLSPCPTRDDPEADVEGLRRFFKEHHTPFVDYV